MIEALAPFVDAANIDLKCFSAEGYRDLGGSLEDVRHTIAVLGASETCHLEVTTLVVPGISDSEDAMRREAAWLASVSEKIVLHVTRFFPRWHMADTQPTPVATVMRLADVAREYLPHVHVGNCSGREGRARVATLRLARMYTFLRNFVYTLYTKLHSIQRLSRCGCALSLRERFSHS